MSELKAAWVATILLIALGGFLNAVVNLGQGKRLDLIEQQLKLGKQP